MSKKNQPIHFIKADIDGKLSITNEAMAILKDIKNPVAVISIAGLARTGKSYILNRIVQKITNDTKFKGFNVGSSIDSCTKGIWMWSLPIEIQLNGKKISVLILDTEGLASLDEEQTHDAKIFTMAILLSSLFVYNSMGTIDQSAIERLSLVCELTKLISAKNSKAKSKEQEERELSKYSPYFLWVLRDFVLELQHEQKEITSTEYLEHALKTKPEKTENSAAKHRNVVRKSIQTIFPERDCFTLVRPVLDEKKLRSISQMTEKELRPEFVEQMNELLNIIQNNLKVKEINGNSLNGLMFSEIAKSYVHGMNNGSVPSIAGTWESLSEIQCLKAASNANEFIEKKLEEIKNVDINKLSDIFMEIEARALEIFSSTAVGDTKEHLEKLMSGLKNKFEKKKKEIEKNSEMICQKMMDNIIKTIHFNFSKGQYKSFNDLKKDLFPALNKYKAETSGPFQIPIYVNFIEKEFLEMIEGIESTRDNQEKLKTEKFEEEKKKMMLEIQNLKGQNDVFNEKLKEFQSVVKEKKKLEDNIVKLQDEIQKKVINIEEASKKESILQKRITMLENESNDKKIALSNMEKDKRSLEDAFSKLKEDNLKKVNQIDEIHKREETLQKKILSIEKDHSEKISKKLEEIYQLETLKKSFEKQVKQLEIEIKKTKDEKERSKSNDEKEINQLKELIDKEKSKLNELKEKSEREKEKSKKDYENQIGQLKEKLDSESKESNREKEKSRINQDKIKSLDNEIKTLKDQLMNSEKLVRQLKDKEKEMESQKKDFEKSIKNQEEKINMELKTLKVTNMNLEKENKKVAESLKDLEKEKERQIEKLKSSVEDKTKEITFMTYELENVKNEMETLRKDRVTRDVTERTPMKDSKRVREQDFMDEEVEETPQKSQKKDEDETPKQTPKRKTPSRRDSSRLSSQVIKSTLKELRVEFDPNATKSKLEKQYNEIYDKIEKEEEAEKEKEKDEEIDSMPFIALKTKLKQLGIKFPLTATKEQLKDLLKQHQK